jgi:hypothetical protein
MNTHENLEHAEHAEHNASDPFNQRVAVSMAIVAALLAGISMVGHRTHNKVLQLQGEANRHRTEAATAEVEKSNLFAWYQSKRLRQSEFEISAKLLELVPAIEPARKDDDDTKKKAADQSVARTKAITDWKTKAAEYNKSNEKKDNLPDLIENGNEAGKRSEASRKKADTVHTEAEHTHHQADRFDVAHLSAEIGLVLCSIALLTKKKAYWFIGLTAAVVAIALTVSAYMIPHESHDTPAHARLGKTPPTWKA